MARVRRAVLARLLPIMVASAALLAPSAAGHQRQVHPLTARIAQAGDLTTPCGGAPIRADRVVTGSFGTEMQGSYVMVPFDVPAGATAVRVKYCWDQPENPVTAGQGKQTPELGASQAPRDARALWGEGDFRGWGGAATPDGHVARGGVSPPGASG